MNFWDCAGVPVQAKWKINMKAAGFAMGLLYKVHSEGRSLFALLSFAYQRLRPVYGLIWRFPEVCAEVLRRE